MKYLRPAVLSLLAMSILSGCFLVPAYDSFRQTGITASQRIGLLPQELKRFNDALYWGKPGEALSFAAPENVEELRPGFISSRDKVRVVDSNVRDVQFDKEAHTADVEMTVRYYEVPFFVVQERTERQKWEFSLTGGWKLTAREVSDRS